MFHGAVAVLVSLLLVLSGGGVTATAYDDREESAVSLEFTASDDCPTTAPPLAGYAVREGHHPRRRTLPLLRPAAPAACPHAPLLAARADAAPACAARAGHTVLRC
ncbi:hypothetical protein CTZ27_29275 [Streptomyces griseocarneus]|nr:hypothetical protein CTZ27_29275 [Streptomyces griseocarneus]